MKCNMMFTKHFGDGEVLHIRVCITFSESCTSWHKHCRNAFHTQSADWEHSHCGKWLFDTFSGGFQLFERWEATPAACRKCNHIATGHENLCLAMLGHNYVFWCCRWIWKFKDSSLHYLYSCNSRDVWKALGHCPILASWAADHNRWLLSVAWCHETAL